MSDEPRETTDAAGPTIQVTDKRRLFMDAEAVTDAPTEAVPETPAEPPSAPSPDLHQLQMQLEERQMQLEEREAQIARLRAQVVEFEAKVQEELRETRRRLERTVEQRVLSARQALLEDWLAVFDNLDLMLAGADKATREDLLTGLAAMQRLLIQALQRHDIERIEAVGQPFDPELHEAVETAVVAAEQDGRVVAQSRAGYRLSGRLIRPALVTVGRAESPSAVLSETEIPA
ncbi:MAG: nucleotide exchange factor GrpE [Chloracidobacterium sp.]|nr:nucleotide exchange factor GrpE [Chloracidobacterium sp.]MDW8218116.1 nucleotide exchange factor GrpE [Acidobacteriota bacterium]